MITFLYYFLILAFAFPIYTFLTVGFIHSIRRLRESLAEKEYKEAMVPGYCLFLLSGFSIFILIINIGIL